MLSQILELLGKIEDGIGNQAKPSIRKCDEGLEFRVYWPDGYILSHRIAASEVHLLDNELLFVSYFIHKAKEAHPALAPFIS